MRYPLKMSAKMAGYIAGKKFQGQKKFPMVLMLELSTWVAPVRLRRICDAPESINLRRFRLSASLVGPMVARPWRSRIATLPACRTAIWRPIAVTHQEEMLARVSIALKRAAVGEKGGGNPK